MKLANLLTPEEIMALVGIGRNTFQLMLAKGQLPEGTMIGNRRYWLKPVIEKWISKGCKKPV